MIERDYPLVGGYPTLRLQTVRRETQQEDILALIICGNPGVPLYYEEFMQAFDESCNGIFPICCISHVGHGAVPKDLKYSTPKENLCSLEGQIRHKLHYIKDHIPKSTKLILIGHSIGCYIILQLLDKLEEDQVLKSILLFPVVERIALSPRGITSAPKCRNLGWLASILMYSVHYMIPDFVKRGIIRWHFKGSPVPESAIEATMKLTDPYSLRNIMDMTNQEMKAVTKADYDVIERHMDKLMWYYGATDHWCPVEYYEDMKKRYPEMDITLCKEGIDHAFVLESSVGMAKLTVDWLRCNLPKYESVFCKL